MQDENMSSHSADANEASLHEDKHDEDATKDGLPQALVGNIFTICTNTYSLEVELNMIQPLIVLNDQMNIRSR